jgi:hypothetical protein
MKRAATLLCLLVLAAGYVFLQTPAPSRELSTLAPGGATLYLEAQDFSALLRDWDASKVKVDWLASDNYAVFSRSNLFQKLGGVYQEYGETAGFLPDLKSVIGLAGTQAALALYDLREVEFLYISRLGQAQFSQSALAAVRGKFEQRQAGGVTFYLRTDPASKRTVAFTTSGGYLFLATRDDLVARALALLAGGSDPSVASEPWYHDATATAQRRGDLRLVMNLDALVKSAYFRSYWIQRNTSALRDYWAGVADVNRSRSDITETRVFLRRSEAAGQARAPADRDDVGRLVALVPTQAGEYKAYNAASAPDPAALIIERLIATPPRQSRDWRYAPSAISPDERPGSEADLETRIDEPPLPVDAGGSSALRAVRTMLQGTGVKALLHVQSSNSAGETFIRTPSVIVLEGAGAWDAAQVRQALSESAGALWTVSAIGAGWTSATFGRQSAERLDGLGTLLFATRGPLLFLGNNPALLSAMLDRAGSTSAAAPATYAAGFRHLRERAAFERMMSALDFTSPQPGMPFGFVPASAAPAFFSGNLASLDRVLATVFEISVTAENHTDTMVQRVVYRIAP